MTTAISMEDFTRASEKLQHHSFAWKRIAQGLGFTADELAIIEATPTLLIGAPSSYLNAMLAQWQQWAPGDFRGSKGYATLDSLRRAQDWDSLHSNSRHKSDKTITPTFLHTYSTKYHV